MNPDRFDPLLAGLAELGALLAVLLLAGLVESHAADAAPSHLHGVQGAAHRTIPRPVIMVMLRPRTQASTVLRCTSSIATRSRMGTN